MKFLEFKDEKQTFSKVYEPKYYFTLNFLQLHDGLLLKTQWEFNPHCTLWS